MTDRADFPNLGNRFVRRGEQTGGEFALVEHTLAPRSLAAPTHTHRNEDEYSFVLSGRIGAHVGEEFGEFGPGELLVKPRGIPHAFWNAAEEKARVLELITPGGFERYFAELAPLLNTGEFPDLEAVAALCARYELAMDFESIGPLAERFGLSAF
ncbi:MAG: hypothetical protein QOE75_2237 [Solirubrobacterales bacterium]|jgi:mannose-6-phosphate isomerase-like protein (cupin superfamily)|nr:hypothetical protein [Solirubrobacterales bacterium]